MDKNRFDAFTVVLTHLTRRRQVVVMLFSGAVGLHRAIAAVAANRKARRRQRRRKELRRRCLEACGSEPPCNFCLHTVDGGIGCLADFTPSCTQECTGATELECGLFGGCMTASQPVGGAKKTTLCGGQFATGVCVQFSLDDLCT